MYTARDVRPRHARRLLRWYDRNFRDLPWRRTRDPYAVLVSEVMLQQTQVARALPAYHKFLVRFPTLGALARSSVGDVLRAWSGLGYNRRARDLHRIARLHPRRLPLDTAALDALPGIGAYTAGAVVCFAGGRRVAFADTNIKRVLGRVVLGRVATEREAVAIDERLMPRRQPDRWHHALMDLGATVCLARAPACPSCPLRAECRSRDRAVAAPRRRQTPFASSDRRVRGRIVALLRERSQSVAALRRTLDDARVPRLVDALVEEGIVERRGPAVRLPV